MKWILQNRHFLFQYFIFTGPNILTFIYFFIGIYINSISQVYTQYRSNQHSGKIIIPDIGHDFFPYTNPKWPDYFVYSFIILTIFKFFFGCTVKDFQIRIDILRRHLFCLGTLFFLRAFSIYCSILPNPDIKCITDVQLSPWYEALRIITFQTVTCADCMFSAHTANITTLALTWQYYANIVPANFGWFTIPKIMQLNHKSVMLCVWFFSIAGYVSIISSRFHYTLDVYISIILSIFVFILYNMAIHTKYFTGTFLGNFIDYCERDAIKLHL
jgi:hypothetical protein